MSPDLKGQIAKLAAAYTPEWRYNEKQPDIGTVLANLFAGLMEETISSYQQMPKKIQADFVKAMGAAPIASAPAVGYAAFKLARADMPAAVVPEKTGLIADVAGQDLVRYETTEDVYVSAAEVSWYQEQVPAALYICFDRCPDQGVISLLFLLPEGGRNVGSQAVWEYRNQDGWKIIQVEDGTANLNHTGLIRLAGRPDWCSEEIREQEGYWLRAHWRGKNPFGEDGIEIHINAAGIIASEPGRQGNLQPGNALELVKPIGFVTNASNPDVLYGGADAEAEAAAVKRGCARNRHRFKAVTPGDFESLIYERYPQIHRAVCFPGYNKSGERQRGAVTVVVVTDDYPEGGRYFYTIARELLQWLEPRTEAVLAASGSLTVIQPKAVRVSVICELAVKRYGEILRINNRINEALTAFLHPRTGNHHGRGWDPGEIPGYNRIKSFLIMQPGITGFNHLRISYNIETDQGFAEISEEQLKTFPWALPQAGQFQLAVVVEGGV